jgi:hypothetical protein
MLNLDTGVCLLRCKKGHSFLSEQLDLVTPPFAIAIFGQCPIERRQKVGYLVWIVLKPNGQAACVRLFRQPEVIPNLVFISQWKAYLVSVAVNDSTKVEVLQLLG